MPPRHAIENQKKSTDEEEWDARGNRTQSDRNETVTDQRDLSETDVEASQLEHIYGENTPKYVMQDAMRDRVASYSRKAGVASLALTHLV